jgi:hypothetical protein
LRTKKSCVGPAFLGANASGFFAFLFRCFALPFPGVAVFGVTILRSKLGNNVCLRLCLNARSLGRYLQEGLEPDDRDGFVIINAASGKDMVDIHDRKPLVLSPEHACARIDADTSADGLASQRCSTPDQLPSFTGAGWARM